jgi:acyl-CoA synthetase (AMP-forming)/AMP-acid ligase II
VSDDGAVCAAGDSGELQFRSPTNMLGYWRRPEATQAAFTADGWLRTGDIGYWREDGNISLVGRRAEMFKSGGFNVYPREVELALETHPQVALAAVISQPDPLYSEVGKAYVVATAGASLDSSELSRHVRERLANYKVPKIIQIVAEIPVLANGKIDKQALRAANAV